MSRCVNGINMAKTTAGRKVSAAEMMADLHEHLRRALGAHCPTMINMAAYCIEFHRAHGRALTLAELVEHFRERQ